VPTIGQGFPRPDIPAEIDTLERLGCWLGIVANQLGEFIKYCGELQVFAFNTQTQGVLPAYTIDIRGLTFDRDFFVPLIDSSTVSVSGGQTSAEGIFAAQQGVSSPGEPDNPGTPQSPNNEFLADKLNESRENSSDSAAAPPATNPGAGYDRIDTLPVCAEQDPKVKAYSKPLAELLK
jgi:hypothetical protein